MHGDGTVYAWAEQFADGSGFTYTGFITKAPVETKTEDEANTMTFSLKLTSKAAFNATLTVATGS